MQRLLLLYLTVLSCSSMDMPSDEDVGNNMLSSEHDAWSDEALRDIPGETSARWGLRKDKQTPASKATNEDGLDQGRSSWWRRDKNKPKKTKKNRTETKTGRQSAKTRSRKNHIGACYLGLGCFDSGFYGLDALPDSSLTVKSFFLMYRRDEREGIKFTYLRVEEAARLISEPTKLIIIVHGFTSSSKASWAHLLKEKSLEITDCAVIIVDWKQGASKVAYKQAVTNSQLIGRQVARILFQLMEKTGGNISPDRTHWMGHSLGAQMTIYFWDYFRELTNGRIISKITALDPAASFYEHNNFYLNTSMADFVEVIHTSSGSGHGTSYGMSIPVGHVDFYMNGGDSPQPGCYSVIVAACSHSRAQLYYAEAIDIKSPCTMFSYSCMGGRAQYDADECDVESDNWSAITFDNTQNLPGRGIQFINTNPYSPFCIPMESSGPDKKDDPDKDDDCEC